MAKTDTLDLDPVLADFSAKVEPFAAEVEADMDYSVLALGTKIIRDPNEVEPKAVQTLYVCSGTADVLADGLYYELASQIEAGDLTFFRLLATVVHDLAQDFGMDRQEYDEEDEDSEESTFH